MQLGRGRDLSVLSVALVGATVGTLIDWRSAPSVSVERVADELVHLYTAAVT